MYVYVYYYSNILTTLLTSHSTLVPVGYHLVKATGRAKRTPDKTGRQAASQQAVTQSIFMQFIDNHQLNLIKRISIYICKEKFFNVLSSRFRTLKKTKTVYTLINKASMAASQFPTFGNK